MTGWEREVVLRPVVGRFFAGASLAGLLTSLAIAQQSPGDGYAGATVSVRFADATDAVGAAGLAFSDIVTQSVTATASASLIFQNAVDEYNSSRSYIVAFGEDDDSDRVPDGRDQCLGTAFEADVDANGCAQVQVDEDLDSVCNAAASSPRWCTGTDVCPNTPPGTVVDDTGCPVQPPGDTDSDGVPDIRDHCPGTQSGTPVDSNGCAPVQVDFDRDGHCDPGEMSTWCRGFDNCPAQLNSAQGDSDGDGIGDACDLAPVDPTDLDTDGDGLPDKWEVLGFDENGDGFAEVPLWKMGADPVHKDIFVEVDHMGDDTHDDLLPMLAVLLVVDRFKQHGIRLHVDSGRESVMIRLEPHAQDIRWGDLAQGGEKLIDHIDFLPTVDDGWVTFDRLESLKPARRKIFHYVIAAHSLSRSVPALGISRPASWTISKDPVGKDFAVAQAEFNPTGQSAKAGPMCAAGPTCLVAQAANFMHELGHNLGLRHGGDEDKTYKPNYISVMNYTFSVGVPRRNGEFFVDYSSGTLNDVALLHLDEQEGLSPDSGLTLASGGSATSVVTRYACPQTTEWKYMNPVRANGPIDWNCDGTYERDTPAPDIACLTNEADRSFCLPVPALRDHDDWLALRFDAGGLIGGQNVDQQALDPSPSTELPIRPVIEGAFADQDEDGISDNFDNCPGRANPDQVDSNDDGYGDACQTNYAPAANAGPDRTVEATSRDGAHVDLDGTASFDLDRDFLSMVWSGPSGTLVGSSLTVEVPIGTHEITLTVNDGRGGISTDAISVTVRDSISPMIAITTPANVSYNFGQAVETDYACTDSGSGVAMCSGPVPNGANIDTGSLGPKMFTVNASDNVGNVSTRSVTYTVVTIPPVAQPDTADTLENVGVSIPVVDNDSDADGGVLTVSGANTPPHGITTIGEKGAITYTPAAGFFGTDTFTYTINDGQGGTGEGTVTVKVSRLARFVALGAEQLVLRAKSRVVTGDVGVNASIPGMPRDGDEDDDDESIEVRIGRETTMEQADSRIVGDTVLLERDASVFDVSENELINRGAHILGVTTTPVKLPFVRLPDLLPVAHGAQDVTVRRNRVLTLAPGTYGRVQVRRGGTLIVNGSYQLLNLDLARDATVLVRGATELRLKGELGTDARARIVIDSQVSGLDASDVVIFVAGNDGDCRHGDWDSEEDDGGQAAVHIGQRNVIQANIHAPNGSLWMKSGTIATGAFIAKRVRIGAEVTLTLDSAFR